MKSICVYCGSSIGASPDYAEGARALAAQLVKNNIGLVYGGGNVGLMGTIATEVIRLGGEVTGIIPKALVDKELSHTELTRLHVVKDMHERKAMMAEQSDGFIAMPGGMGTLEELFEILTWAQLGFHQKPVGLLNTNGFYDKLIEFVHHQVEQRFVGKDQVDVIFADASAEVLVEQFKAYVPTYSGKWGKNPQSPQ
jgi:uncharacterized protein (TIGR00730 family)